MAVVDAYMNADVAANKKASALLSTGAQEIVMIESFEVATADDNNSVYRVFKNVNPHYVPIRLDISCDAITGMSDVNVGLYKSLDQGGAVIDDNCFGDAIDLSSAVTRTVPKDGLVSVNLADAEKPIYELAGDTLATKELGYDICLTAIAAASTDGTVFVVGRFAYKG